MICSAVLSPIVFLVRTLIAIVREVVRTVCEWVSSIITVIVEVVKKVCSSLPWPLNKICGWVTTLIEVVQTVWDWVCTEVIERIVDWIEIIVEYVIYVLKWVCWVIDWVVRLPGLLLCLLGVEPPKFMAVCVKILADEAGNPAIPIADVQAMMRDAAAIFRRCNLNMVICSFEIVIKPGDAACTDATRPAGLAALWLIEIAAFNASCDRAGNLAGESGLQRKSSTGRLPRQMAWQDVRGIEIRHLPC